MPIFTDYNCPNCGSCLERLMLKPTDNDFKERYRCIACLKEFVRPHGKEQYEKFIGLPYLVEVSDSFLGYSDYMVEYPKWLYPNMTINGAELTQRGESFNGIQYRSHKRF